MAEETFVNRRLWLFNAALRKACGKDNPHEPIQDQYSFYIEDHVDDLADDILKKVSKKGWEEALNDIWMNFNPENDVQSLTNKIKQNQLYTAHYFKNPENISETLIKQVAKESVEYEKLASGMDPVKVLTDMLSNKEDTESVTLVRDIKKAQEQIDRFKEDKLNIIRDDLWDDTKNLMAEAISNPQPLSA